MLGAAHPPWYSSHRWLAASWLPPTAVADVGFRMKDNEWRGNRVRPTAVLLAVSPECVISLRVVRLHMDGCGGGIVKPTQPAGLTE